MDLSTLRNRTERGALGRLAIAVCFPLLALWTPAPAEDGVSVSGGGLSLDLARDDAKVVSLTESGGRAGKAQEAGLRFIDGRTRSGVPLRVTAWDETGFRGVVGQTEVEVRSAIDCSPERVVLALKLRNTSSEERLLEVRLVLPAACASSPHWSFFDGAQDTHTPSKVVRWGGLKGALPLSAVCDSAAGVAIGLDPREYHSWLSPQVTPDEAESTFSYAVRRVLDPGQVEPVTFVLFGFDGSWGTAMAVERYYDLFPDCFRQSGRVDSRFSLVGGYVRSGWQHPPLRWEESRRLFHGWQPYWGHRRTGDWMPDAKYWPARAGNMTAFVESLRRQYSLAAPGNPMTHYLQITQCEADLAEQVFPDAIRWTRDGAVRRHLHAVPILRGEACCYVFPFANRLWEEILADVPRIITDLSAGGIYFDNAGGGMRHYRKELIRGLSGRAYDDDGAVYATSGMALAAVAELAHSTKSGRHFAGVCSNSVGTYAVARHLDTTIGIEGTPWERAEWVAGMRRLMGQKTLCWWEDHLPNVLRWRDLTPAQIIEAMRGNVEYCLLYGLRWGVLPAVHQQRGRAMLVKHMPLMVELVRAGWRPVSAVRGDSRLWYGRFGTGVGSMVTVSNPTRETVRCKLRIDNRVLGEDSFLFAYHEKTPDAGKQLVNELADNNTTFEIRLAPKEFRVIRAALNLRPGTDGLTAEVSEERDEYQRIATRCCIVHGSARTRVAAWQPERGALSALTVDSRPVDANMEVTLDKDRSLRVDVEEGVALGSPKQGILSFPFMRDQRPASAIVLPPSPTPAEKTAVQRLSSYFEYWLGRRENLVGLSPDRLVNPSRRLPIGAPSTDTARVLVGTPDGHPAIASLTGSVPALGRLAKGEAHPIGAIALAPSAPVPTLVVAAASREQVDEVVLHLLTLLDEKYPVSWGLYSDGMTNKAGVAGEDFTGSETAPQIEMSEPPELPVTLDPKNLLRNAGFEEGDPSPSHWSYSSPNPDDHKCTFSQDACEGKRSVFVPRRQWWEQKVKLEAGRRYRLTAWRKLGAHATFRLAWCGIQGDGTERGGGKLYEQCKPTIDLIPDFVSADYFSRPDVWCRAEMAFRAPDYAWIAIRLGGWGRVQVDGVSLVEVGE